MLDDIQQLSFEDAYNELTALVESMQSGSLTLEQSVEHYERGQALAAHCDHLLEQAELRIKQIDELE